MRPTRPRVIPVLLIKNRQLVKTVRYKNARYVGDPINAIRIFNEKGADEVTVLDITATKERRGPDFDFVKELADECFMPLGYGGGIRTTADVKRLVNLGVEKVCINSEATQRLDFLAEAAAVAGSQSIVFSLDVTRTLFGNYRATSEGGTRKLDVSPVDLARRAEAAGAGEILLNAIHRDGTFSGYDLDLLRMISDAVDIPVIGSGGASTIADFIHAIREGHASAVAAGSMFIFKGPHRAVLISLPSEHDLLPLINLH